jgi:5-methylcytosine-specific restriction endonuclease McrBC regulatory subunit McrC
VTQEAISVGGGRSVSIALLADVLGDQAFDEVVQSLVDLRSRIIRERGIEPYDVRYDRQGRLAIIPTSYVGQLRIGRHTLALNPRIPGLDFGRVLYLASLGNVLNEVRHDNQVIEQALSAEEHIEGVDFFVRAFLSSCIDVLNNGVLSLPKVRTSRSRRLHGELVVHRQVQEVGFFYPYLIRWTEQSIDIPENRLIKKALVVCLRRASNDGLRRIASECLRMFSDADEQLGETSGTVVSSTVRRPDYERSLRLAELIVEGFDPYGGARAGFLPYFLLNLDEVFESFIAAQLKAYLVEPSVAHTKWRTDHGFQPKIASRYIELDVLFERGSSRVVVDAKNKYSSWFRDGSVQPANPDIFQTFFYASRVGAQAIVLVYPSKHQDRSRFPVLGSQGQSAYEASRQEALEAVSSLEYRLVHPSGLNLPVIPWRVGVTGTPAEIQRSVVELANFLIEFTRSH